MENYLNDFNGIIEKYPFLKTVILSLALMIIFYVIKVVTTSNIDKKNISVSDKALIKKKLNQYLFYFMSLLLFLVWFSRLQVFFVSLIAIAAAIVIAFKELIMCLTGGLLNRFTKAFTPGQRIEVEEVRGFVIESGMLVTKILEIGPEKNSQQTTGNITTIPNSLLLSNAVKNASYFKGYSIKSYQFKIESLEQVEAFEQAITPFETF